MNLLITGCNGQLGNEMQILAKKNLQFHYFFTDLKELDICNEALVAEYIHKNEIDCIVNCAAFTAVDKAESELELCDRLNHLAPGYLAKAVNTRGGSMIQISTDYVFDGTAHLPYKEDEPTCPNTVYGNTKLAGEQLAISECKQTIVIRTAWLYSTFGNNFVKTMLRLGREKDKLGVISDQIGTPTYAANLAEAIFEILSQKIVPGIYHYSNEGVISWYDFTKAIHRIANLKSCEVNPLHTEDYPVAATRPNYSVLDKTKIKQVYGIHIPYWEESLAKCIALLEQK
ncbi:MAG: dTDP-4-dehydrorhamnose reductase [Bacteroidaceae bacterium]